MSGIFGDGPVEIIDPRVCLFWVLTGECPGLVVRSLSPGYHVVGAGGRLSYPARPAAVRRRLAVIASHSDSSRMTIPSRACSPPIHLLLSPAAASAV